MPAMSNRSHHEIAIDADCIAATLFRPEKAGADGVAPIVICAHGLTGSRIGACYRFVRLGQRLAEEGIACLTFDFRGCGESDGRFIDLTCDRLQRDMRSVIDWVARRTDLDSARVGLCGSSFGAFTSAQVAGHAQGLKALVFWAPVARPRHLFDRAMTRDASTLLDRQGWLEHRGMPLGKGFFELDADAEDGPVALSRAAKPLLMFHAQADAEVPFDHAEAYQSALQAIPVDVTLQNLDLPDHGMRAVEANERIVRESVQWFVKYLL